MLEHCRAGDEVAWAQLVAQHERYVYAICTRGYSLGAADAEDVFQEAFVRTWHQLDRIPDEPALRAWLGQVTRRLCIDRLRALKRTRPEADAGMDQPAPGDQLGDIERALDVHAALAGLCDEHREVLDRFFCQDHSYAQISVDLDIAMGTVASRISRGLAGLREHVDADG